MSNFVGSLCTAFNSSITVQSADFEGVTFPQILVDLSHSNVSLAHFTINDAIFGDEGSFITASGNSNVRLSALSLISASDQRLIHLDKSMLMISSSTITNLNVSLIIAHHTVISIVDTEVRDIELGGSQKPLEQVPDGGLLMCTNCPLIMITAVRCRNVSANRGGVVYAQVTSQNLQATLVVEQSQFEGCLAMTYGGVVYTVNANLTLFQSEFTNNSALNGGAVNFESKSHLLVISNSSFVLNSARIAGACLRWTGLLPSITSVIFVKNSALYGNPQASVSHHLILQNSTTLQPVTQFPMQGITGQKTSEPLLLGVFDVMGN